MKRLFLGSIVLFIALTSCMNKEKINSMVESKFKDSSSNTKDETYQPGKDWKLTWSDEFDGETINAKNWNLQVVNAGRFNEEWQRYTNSKENAYIEDGKLVLKAIHENDEHGLNQYT